MLIVSVLGLVFAGLVATALFTVMAQRRQRALGMLASLGAAEADVRFVLIADGLFAGVIGAGLGGAAAGWLLGDRAPSAVSRQPLEYKSLKRASPPEGTALESP